MRRLRLDGLDPAAIAARVEALMGEPPSRALLEEITARGQGNPFFTEELVAAHLAGQPIPELLGELLSADIASVDDDTRRVLEAIAVVGRGTSHELLAELIRMDASALERAVKAAVDAHLVVVEDDTTSYRFRHALIGEVVYADLLPAARRRLHDEGGGRSRTTATRAHRVDEIGELAVHLDRAGDHDGALVAALAAADAAEASAPGVALRHLERALELWDLARPAPGEARADRLWQAAELASGTVGNDRAVELARDALLAGEPPAAEPGGTNGSVATCGRRVSSRRASSSSVARPICSATTRARGRHRRSPGSASPN